MQISAYAIYVLACLLACVAAILSGIVLVDHSHIQYAMCHRFTFFLRSRLGPPHRVFSADPFFVDAPDETIEETSKEHPIL